MNKEYFQIKDLCRKGLLRYLEKAITHIPGTGNYRMMDIGCGTGVPTLFMAEHYNGFITAIDIDKPALIYFQDKLDDSKYRKRIEIQNINLIDFKGEKDSYDIVLAEGLLNVFGFESGFKKILEYVKQGGYLIVHDEFKNHKNKTDFIRRQNCTLIESLYLNEHVWWNDYYKCLDKKIEEITNSELRSYFKGDLLEIENYKTDSIQFRSVYYIILKN